jgi:uncharacterized protein YuzE
MAKFRCDYDKESDDLFIYSGKKSKGSIEIGDLILDFDPKGKLTSIELLNAVDFMKNSINNELKPLITRSFLENIEECQISSKEQNNFIFIKITFVSKKAKISFPINAPVIHETSPALAYA